MLIYIPLCYCTNGIIKQNNDKADKAWTTYKTELSIVLPTTDGAATGAEICAANNTIANSNQVLIELTNSTGRYSNTILINRPILSNTYTVTNTYYPATAGYYVSIAIIIEDDGQIKGMSSSGNWGFTIKAVAVYYKWNNTPRVDNTLGIFLFYSSTY